MTGCNHCQHKPVCIYAKNIAAIPTEIVGISLDYCRVFADASNITKNELQPAPVKDLDERANKIREQLIKNLPDSASSLTGPCNKCGANNSHFEECHNCGIQICTDCFVTTLEGGKNVIYCLQCYETQTK